MSQFSPGLVKQFLLGISKHPANRPVHLYEAPIQPRHAHGEGCVFEDLAESLIALPNLPLGQQARADITADDGSARHFSRWIPDRRDGEQDIDPTSVLLLENSLKRTDGVCLPDCLDATADFIIATGRSEDGGISSNDFLARITEQNFGASVPTEDSPI